MITEKLIRTFWITLWDFSARYHRYEVEGLENLDKEPAVIAGYHGRGLAIDLCILSAKLEHRLGYLPHCVVHRDLTLLPGVKTVIDALGFVSHDDEKVAQAVERREHILTPPGGASEGMRSYLDNYRVEWPSTGYIKLAIRHKLPIVPVAAAGADETYIGLLDGEEIALRLGLHKTWAWAPWTGIGLLGLYPFSPPFPVQLYQVIGEPISTEGLDIDDASGIQRLHQQITKTVQDLLEYAIAQKESKRTGNGGSEGGGNPPDVNGGSGAVKTTSATTKASPKAAGKKKPAANNGAGVAKATDRKSAGPVSKQNRRKATAKKKAALK